MQLTFRADPPDLALSSAGLQQQIVGMLGGQQAIESLFSRNPDVGSLLRNQLTGALTDSFLPELFERLGIAQALGFETLSVDVGGLNTFTLQATRHLIGPFYATYDRRLSGGPTTGTLGLPGWDFKLSYRFTSNLQLSYSTDDQKRNAYLLEGVFKF
jgi:hypothetical protein